MFLSTFGTIFVSNLSSFSSFSSFLASMSMIFNWTLKDFSFPIKPSKDIFSKTLYSSIAIRFESQVAPLSDYRSLVTWSPWCTFLPSDFKGFTISANRASKESILLFGPSIVKFSKIWCNIRTRCILTSLVPSCITSNCVQICCVAVHELILFNSVLLRTQYKMLIALVIRCKYCIVYALISLLLCIICFMSKAFICIIDLTWISKP